MKLEKQGFANIYGTAAGGQRFTATIRQGIGSTADLRGIHDEIVRRVNAHDALVEALKNIASEPMPMIGDVETCKSILRRIDKIATAALALAAASETRIEADSDAKTGTQGKECK